MGVCAYLVSDEKEEYCDLGKTVFSVVILEQLKCGGAERRDELGKWLRDSRDYLNTFTTEPDEIADVMFKWIQNYPDWRYITDADEEFDDVYLAVDEEDAREYKEEFGDECGPVYMKTASVYRDAP